LKLKKPDSAPTTLPVLLRLGLLILFMVVVSPIMAQNTKGDDQVTKPSRETRFKSKPKKSKSKSRVKRLTPSGKTPASSAVRGPREKERAWAGDVTGRKIPATRSKARKKEKNIYSQPRQTTVRQPSQRDDAQSRTGDIPPKRIKPRTSSAQARNVYPQRGPYVKNTRPPKRDDTPYKSRIGASAQPRIKSSSGKTRNVYPQRGPYVAKKIAPSKDDKPRNWRGSTVTKPRVRTATGKTKNVFPQSGPYVARRPAPPKNEKSNKNVFPQRGPFVSNASPQPRQKESPPGKKKTRKAPLSVSKPFIRRTSINPYAGFWNKKQKGEKAYIGDISGKPLRTKNFETARPEIIDNSAAVSAQLRKQKRGDKPFSGKPKGYVSATQPGKAWQGDITGRSVRYRNFSSKGKVQAGQPVAPLRNKGARPTERAGEPKKPFLSASGKSWNNEGRPVSGRMPKRIDLAGAKYQGTYKAKRPLKGGGSISGELWNNNGQPISGRAPGKYALSMGTYQGNLKANKPLKGGGSISGQLWNNKGQPISGRAPGKYAIAMGTYQGNLKANKPLKGGGSVSGQLWNNNEQPIAGRAPGKSAIAMGTYQGNMKAGRKEPSKEVGGYPGKYRMFDLHPSMRKQGEDFTGHIRRASFGKDRVQYPYAFKGSLKKDKPDNDIKFQKGYVIRTKQSWDYIHNPSSDKEALKVHETGKAFARASDYQGNIKMKKYELFGKKNLHPDAQFVRNNKNNVKEERDAVTNFKLFWARLFKKSETQPNHLKEPVRKPRYDKREIGMWYD
jgi:hypothetical protein